MPILYYLQGDELLQPEDQSEEPNVELLTQLLSMGFDLDKSRQALLSTGNAGLLHSFSTLLSQKQYLMFECCQRRFKYSNGIYPSEFSRRCALKCSIFTKYNADLI